MDRPTRRVFLQGSLGLAGVGLLAGCGLVPSQPAGPARLPTVGYLGTSSSPGSGSMRNYASFLAGLNDLRYVEGRNIVVEARWTEGQTELLPDRAAELIALPVDIFVGDRAVAASAAGKLTQTIPIIFAQAADPAGTGLVCSLAHPCANLTGLSSLAEGLDAKRLELIRDAIPGLSRVGVLWHQPGMASDFRRAQDAAQALGFGLQSLALTDPNGLDSAFQAAVSGNVQAVAVVNDALTAAVRTRIVELALQLRLPTIFQTRDFVDGGGLMSYGANIDDQFRRAATYVDKILKGARPADLPVEQPEKFECIINLRTAKTLGLTIPPSVLMQATETLQ